MCHFLKRIRYSLVKSLCLICVGLLALPSMGNAASNRSSGRFSSVLAQSQVLREGLTSLFAVPNGIYGSFEIDGKIIYFETRRGPRTPKHLRDDDPATPQFEIDARFMNQDGEPFLTQIGGDAPLDPTWTEFSAENKSDKQAKIEFELASKAIATLRKLKFARQFVHERKALLDLAPVLESAQVIEKVEGAPDQALSGSTLLADNIYSHRVEIHHKSCCLGLAYHSATIGKYIDPYGVVTTRNITCNHGTCAHLMALKCSWTSRFPGTRTKNVKNWVSCSTPYNPTSFFGHNSNDDTDLQYSAGRDNYFPSTTEGVCNNIGANNAPTDCY